MRDKSFFYKVSNNYAGKLLVPVILLISAFVIGFVIIKAATSSFTHDESYTYLRYVHQSFMDIISYKSMYTNNHILNTIFMKYSERIFRSSEFALRLPNILALLLYILYTYRILKKFNQKLILPLFLLMLLNPYVIDFFGLARGYGLATGFMILSLFHLINYFHTWRNRDLVFFNIGAFLAVMSSFPLLYYYVAALITYNLVLLIDKRISPNADRERYNIFKLNVVHLISLLVTVIFLYEPLRRILTYSIIDFGGEKGLVHDTVQSLIVKSFYEELPAFWITIMKWAVPLVISFLMFIVLRKVLRKDHWFLTHFRGLIIVNLLLILISIQLIIAHYLLNTDYLIQRFAIFLYPIFILNTGWLLVFLFKTGYRNLSIGITSILVIISILNFGKNMNTKYYLDWKYDSDTKIAVEAIMADYLANSKKPDQVSVGVSWVFEPTINFYRQTRHLNWLQPVNREGFSENDDFIYILRSEPEINYYATTGKIILSSDDSNTMLIKNK